MPGAVVRAGCITDSKGAAVLKILFRAMTRNSSGRPDTRRGDGAVRTVYYAVSLVCPPDACRAARECGAHRWLWGDAPRLPMAGCKSVACDCRYRHHQDRRAGPRRRIERGLAAPAYAGVERRRAGKGRRRGDLEC